MNGAHLPHVGISKIIRDRPASQCHTVSPVFGAAQTERGDDHILYWLQNTEHPHPKTHSTHLTMHPLAPVEFAKQNDSKSISANYHGDLLHKVF